MAQVTLTYSETQPFKYTSNIDDVQTKTATWTLQAPNTIEHGTFLDGSPWVVYQPGLQLISTTPEPQVKSVVTLATDDGGANVYKKNLDVTINHTVINPDFGRACHECNPQTYQSNNELRNYPEKRDVLVPGGYLKRTSPGSTTGNGAYANMMPNGRPDQPITGYFPFDSRAEFGIYGFYNGLTYGGSTGFRSTYDSTQAWNRAAAGLTVGDMVTIAVSRYIEPTGSEGIIYGLDGKPAYYTGVWWGVGPSPYDNTGLITSRALSDIPIIDMYANLTVVLQPPPPNSFRPPINWDASDRRNAPIFQEVNDLDSDNLLIDEPLYSIDFDSRTYGPVVPGSNPPRGVYQYGITGSPSHQPTLTYTAGQTYSISYANTQIRILPAATGFNALKYTTAYCGLRINIGYGGTVNRWQEFWSAAAMLRSVPKEIRQKIKRSFIQRGIDLYGARQSLGKITVGDGGHSMDFVLPDLYAYLATGDINMLRLLNLRDVGNTANNTYSSVDQVFFSNSSGIQYHDSTQNRFYTAKNIKKYQHPLRWNDLTIKQKWQGTHPVWGPYQILRVAAPRGYIRPGEYDSLEGYTGSWSSDKLYNISESNISTAAAGRWRTSNNVGLLMYGDHIGTWLRSNTGKIERIVASIPVANLRTMVETPGLTGPRDFPVVYPFYNPNVGLEGITGYPKTPDVWNNADFLFWTQGIGETFTDADTTVDMAPFLLEQFNTPEAGITGIPGFVLWSTVSKNGNPWAFGSYQNFAQSNPVTIAFATKCCETLNLSIPLHFKNALHKYRWLYSSYEGTNALFFNSNTQYDLNANNEAYLSLVRHFYGKPNSTTGIPDPIPVEHNRPATVAYHYNNQWNWRFTTTLNTPTGNWMTARRDAWLAPPPTKTWMEIWTPPPNITVASSGTNQSNAAIPLYTENSTTKIGSWYRAYFTKHLDATAAAQGYPLLYLSSISAQSTQNPVDVGIPFDPYIRGKTLYLWILGQSIPVKMEKYGEGVSTLGQTVPQGSNSWFQYWSFPGGTAGGIKNLWNLLEDNVNTSGIGYRLFYADEDSRFEWNNPDPPEYDTDLNNDGSTNALDLAALLANYGQSGTGLIGDIDGDGDVDQNDLTLLLNGWGSPAGSPRLLVQVPQNQITIRLSTTNITEDAKWTDRNASGEPYSVDSIYPDNKVVTLTNPIEDIPFLRVNSKQEKEISGIINSELNGIGNGAGGVFIQNSQVQNYNIPNAAPNAINEFDVKVQTTDFHTLARQSGGVTLSFVIHGRNDRPLLDEYTESNEVQYTDTPGFFDTDFYKSSSYIAFKSVDALPSVPKFTSTLFSLRKHPHKVYFSLKKSDMKFLSVTGNTTPLTFPPPLQAIYLVSPPSAEISQKISLLDLTSGSGATPAGRKSRVTFNQFESASEIATAVNQSLTPTEAVCSSQLAYWYDYEPVLNQLRFGNYNDTSGVAQRPIFIPVNTTVNYVGTINSSVQQDPSSYTIIDTQPEQRIHIRGDVMPDRGNKNLLGYQVVGSNPRLFGGTNNLGFQVGSYVRISGTSGGQNNGIYQVIGLIDGIDGDTTANTSVNGGSQYQYLELSVPCEGDSIIPEVEGSSITIENVSQLPVLHIKYRVPV